MTQSIRTRPAPLPANELARLQLLRSYCVLDTPPEPMFEDLTALAKEHFRVPIVLVSLIDEHRQFFKSVVGLSVSETSRDVSFCAYALLTDEPLIIPDALEDERFRANPLVTDEPFIRFYAGAPLLAEGGLKLGTFCIIDRASRHDFSGEDYASLQRFAALTSNLIEQRVLPERIYKANQRNARLEQQIQEVLDSTIDSVVLLDKQWNVLYRNLNAERHMAGAKTDTGKNLATIFPETVVSEECWKSLRLTMEQRTPTCVEAAFESDLVMELHAYPTQDGIAVFFRDQTERRQMEAKLHRANERFVLATEATTDGIWDLHCASNEVYFSARWKEILGLPREESVGRMQDWFSCVHPSDSERVRSLWDLLNMNRTTSFETEFRCLHEDGSWRWLLTRAVCQREPDGSLLRVTGSTSDITLRKVTDPLTGLHNRASLIEHLQWRIDKQAEHTRHFGLLFLDIDAFKRVNDSLGHSKGDALLVEVAARLQLTVSTVPGSIVSRIGGDEFVVLMSDVASEEDVLTYAGTLGSLLQRPIDCHGQEVFISASIGIAFGSSGIYTEAAQMLEDADLAMYRAKMNGKAQNVTFSQSMREESVARLELEYDLRAALQTRQFELYYQPKVKLATQEVTGFEALIRWRHPKHGMISPAVFIPIAEELGFILDIGRWVAGEAIRQLGEWRRTEVVDLEATMAVNISTKQFAQTDLKDFLLARLIDAGVPPKCLALEITESILVGDSQAANLLLRELAAAGIGLDLDDFGTGYSSLSYLHRFPFRSVKIDQSFIRRLSTDVQSVSLVAAIIGLATSLSMGVIAEGIETEVQVRTLCEMGCPVGQGYLFSPPRRFQGS